MVFFFHLLYGVDVHPYFEEVVQEERMASDFDSDCDWLTTLLEDVFCTEIITLWEEFLVELNFVNAIEDEFRFGRQIDKFIVCTFLVIYFPMAFFTEVIKTHVSH